MMGWIFGDYQAKLAEAWHIILICGLIAGAVASVVYIPLPRLKIIAAGFCLIGAASIAAYDAGYRARGALGADQQLKAQLEAAQAQAVENARQAQVANRAAENDRANSLLLQKQATAMQDVIDQLQAEQKDRKDDRRGAQQVKVVEVDRCAASDEFLRRVRAFDAAGRRKH